MNEEITAVARDLASRIFALQAGLVAVIRTHPNPEALTAALVQSEDAGMSNMLYLWPEENLETYRGMLETLRRQIPPQ